MVSNLPKRQLSYDPAFTIVELLVVIVVIGILAAITIVSYTGITQRATVTSLTSDLTNVSTQLKLDQVNNGTYPTTLSLANGGKGIPASSGTSYIYAVNNNTNPPTYCIAATKATVSYKITNDSAPIVGDCTSYGLALSLDAGNSASYPGSGTVWTDLSGNGNSGTLNSTGVTYNSANSGALNFDGANGYVSVPNPIVHSVEMWVKPSPIQSANYPTYYNQSGQSTSTGFWWVYTTNTGTDLNWQYANGTINGVITWNGVVTYNVWNHFIFAFDYTNKTITLYKNGVNLGTNSCPGVLLPSSIFYLGDYQASTGSYHLNGLMSYVHVYNRTLTAEEVQQNFNALRGRYGI